MGAFTKFQLAVSFIIAIGLIALGIINFNEFEVLDLGDYILDLGMLIIGVGAYFLVKNIVLSRFLKGRSTSNLLSANLLIDFICFIVLIAIFITQMYSYQNDLEFTTFFNENFMDGINDYILFLLGINQIFFFILLIGALRK